MAKSSSKELELHPNAWERFERAVDAAIKSGPKHKAKENREEEKGKEEKIEMTSPVIVPLRPRLPFHLESRQVFGHHLLLKPYARKLRRVARINGLLRNWIFSSVPG